MEDFKTLTYVVEETPGGVLVDKTKKEEIFQVSTDDDKVFKGGSEIDDDNL